MAHRAGSADLPLADAGLAGSAHDAARRGDRRGDQDWYVDLLFYHRRLRCLVAVDLKIGAFQPEHAGKMNFYFAALDERDREPGDNPSIGLILCRERNRVVVEYALRSVASPIGVAEYKLLVAEALPAALAEALPTPEDLEPGMTLPPPDQDDSA
jgi:YhcG PDDEXK nuclease domain